jgi:glycosyltransferase involved in cell wall biosynthesis
VGSGVTNDRHTPFRWLFCGRLHAQKNLHHLLDEFAAVQCEPESDAVLDLIGDGPMRDSLARHAETLGLSQKVRWHGWLKKDQIRSCYQQADGFLNPSLYEGMPNTVLEAMASGLPVIASDIPGNRTLIRHEINGLLVTPGTPTEIAHAMQRLESDRAWARRLGAAGREYVVSHHSWKNVAQSYLELIQAPAVNQNFR